MLFAFTNPLRPLQRFGNAAAPGLDVVLLPAYQVSCLLEILSCWGIMQCCAGKTCFLKYLEEHMTQHLEREPEPSRDALYARTALEPSSMHQEPSVELPVGWHLLAVYCAWLLKQLMES